MSEMTPGERMALAREAAALFKRHLDPAQAAAVESLLDELSPGHDVAQALARLPGLGMPPEQLAALAASPAALAALLQQLLASPGSPEGLRDLLGRAGFDAAGPNQAAKGGDQRG